MSDYAALRATAEAATPGPWESDNTTDITDDYFEDEDRPEHQTTGWFRQGPGQVDAGDYSTLSWPDARYIALADPQTVLALLDRLGAVEAERDRLAAALRAQAMRYDENGALCFCDTDCYPFDPHIEYCLIARAALEETKP
jgi:Fe-S cluster assembly scaffold protein SufB